MDDRHTSHLGHRSPEPPHTHRSHPLSFLFHRPTSLPPLPTSPEHLAPPGHHHRRPMPGHQHTPIPARLTGLTWPLQDGPSRSVPTILYNQLPLYTNPTTDSPANSPPTTTPPDHTSHSTCQIPFPGQALYNHYYHHHHHISVPSPYAGPPTFLRSHQFPQPSQFPTSISLGRYITLFESNRQHLAASFRPRLHWLFKVVRCFTLALNLSSSGKLLL